jgi:hypothetical protein
MASSFNRAISLTSTLISDLKAAIGDRLASGQSGKLRVRWEELLELHEHVHPIASGGSYGLLGVDPKRPPLFLHDNESLKDDGGNGDDEDMETPVASQASHSSQRVQASPQAAKVAGKQKEEPPKRQQSKAQQKTFNAEIHQLRDTKVSTPFIFLCVFSDLPH